MGKVLWGQLGELLLGIACQVDQFGLIKSL